MKEKRFLIGITGKSTSGKTTLTLELTKILSGKSSLISLDEYFQDKKFQSSEADWEAQYKKFLTDVNNLSKGEQIKIGISKKFSHRLICPNKYNFVEGFLIFSDPKINELFDLKIFMDIPDSEVFKRRLNRLDGKFSENDLEKIKDFVSKYQNLTGSQKNLADVVLDGTDPVERLAKKIILLIKHLK